MARVGIKCAFLAVGFLAFFIAGIRTQEVEDETEFTYSEGPLGPENWGNIKEEWKQCGVGTQQSPIDVVDSSAELDPNLQIIWDYSSADAKLVNRGHDVMLSWPAGGGSIQIDGKQYTLSQCHWHHPSEHYLNNKQYELEMHMVHQSAEGDIAVVGILYEYGEPEPFLAKLTEQLQSLANTTEEYVGVVDPTDIDVESSEYFRYGGSLTTPPCTEGVVWTVVERVQTVSEEQVKLLQDAVHDGFEMNARPLQPLNDRIVKKFYLSPLITDITGLVDVN